ncbi:MAG: methyltransferase [Prevotella sp.]|nr:methyltransferase [Prevotella sp.]
MSGDSFSFKRFVVHQDRCAMKVGTDGVLLGAWAHGGKRILDIGTGTGLIALMMAQRFPEASISGVEIDADAALQAQENVALSEFAARVQIEAVSLQSYVGQIGQEGGARMFDSIVSNPPFFERSLTNPDQSRTLARHASTLTYAELFGGVKRLLAPEGEFSTIIPDDCLSRFVAEGCLAGFFLTRKCAVKTVPRKSPKRYLLAFAKQMPKDLEDGEATLMNADGSRSEWYSELTCDFYIR